MSTVTIGGKTVGKGQPCYVIAEAGVNHNGDLAMARELVDVAVAANADAVKFQTYVTEELITKTAPKAPYQFETTPADESQFDMLKGLELSAENFRELSDYCASKNITFLSTPYDNPSVDLLVSLGVPALKIASAETTNVPLLRYMAATGLTLILSTGMSTLGEIDRAVSTIQESGTEYVLLHCTSNYPAPIEDVNLKAITTLETAFKVLVGYSDHTPGIGVGPYAVALGACMVEKHFTLDTALQGPDHRASLGPDELREFVDAIRMVETALGDGVKRPMPSELPNRKTHRRSLVATVMIPSGTVMTEEMLSTKRPATGMAPGLIDLVVGRTAATDIEPDTLIGVEHLA